MKCWPEIALLAAAAFSTGCTGVLGGAAEDTGAPGSEAESEAVAAALGSGELALRRLTRAQYVNSVEDALGVGLTADLDLEEDHYDEGFAAVGARQVAVSRSGVSKYEKAAALVASRAATLDRYAEASGCEAAVTTEACWSNAIGTLGRPLFRRRLNEEEITRYVALAQAALEQTLDVRVALETALTGLLLSPHFLYQHEESAPAEDREPPRLTSAALAARLALLIWDSGPDEQLLAAAERGELETPEGIEKQVGRLFDNREKWARGMRAFADGYLSLYRLDESPKDPTLFPEYTPVLQASMRTAALLSVTDVVVERDLPFKTLLTQTTHFVDGPLAEHLGAAPPLGSGFERLDWGSGGRQGGLLTEPAVMVLTARAAKTSPTLRGLFVKSLLCQHVPAPPVNVMTSIPESTIPKTRREEFEKHLESPSCAQCHASMDPPGYALEYFDAVGRYRELDQGFPVDGTGSFEGTPFDGPRELAQLVAQHPDFEPCLTEKLLVHSLGHGLGNQSKAAIEVFARMLRESDGRLEPLVRSIVLSKAFGLAPSERL